MTTTTFEPRIYVADLSAYNNGHLIGQWIDATLPGDEIDAIVREMLQQGDGEEWAIHDFDGFEGIDIPEWMDFEQISIIANTLKDSLASGRYPLDLITEIYNVKNIDITECIDYLDDNYSGEHRNLTDWAYSYLEETGGLENVPSHLENYIDFEGYGRDAELGGDIFTINAGGGNIHVIYDR